MCLCVCFCMCNSLNIHVLTCEVSDNVSPISIWCHVILTYQLKSIRFTVHRSGQVREFNVHIQSKLL